MRDRKVKAGALSWKTAGNVWTLVKTLSDDLPNARDRALRVRTDSPATGIKPPLRGKRKEKQYLYPSEFLAFMGCAKVPREWKIAAALALYSYGRDGEVSKLDWRDIDLEHRVLRITRARDRDTGATKSTKTGATRRFNVEPNLLPLLQTMHERAGGKGTWMAVRGDKPLVIRDRCGHWAFTTTELYIREAEVLTEGFGEVFPELPVNCHPIAILPSRIANRAKNKLLRERDTGLEPATFSLGS